MGSAMSNLNNKTVVGWAVIVVGLVGWYVRRHLEAEKLKDQMNNTQKLKSADRQPVQPKKDNKAKRQRMESFANESKQTQKTPATPVSTSQPKTASYSSDDGIDNRAFAQQMAQAKKNKFAAPKATAEQKQKSVKQSKAKAIVEDAGIEKISSPSSTAGIDADDDQSSVTTPSISAADPTGVSDMLEQPAQGPSVLRLTDTAEKQQKPRQSKSPQPTETKKQRQNRKKREQEKALREEEEKDRRVKMEAQRRAARQAEGRAAKDGSAFMAAQKPSAWTDNAVNGNAQQSAAAPAVQPLDTFETAPKPDTATPAKTNGNESSKQNGKKPGWTEIPYSEEEQLAMLQKQAEEDEWVPVKSRKTKKGGLVSETDESANELSTPVQTSTASISKSTVPNGRPKAQAMPTQSSFVSLKDEGADLADEQEENEWDV